MTKLFSGPRATFWFALLLTACSDDPARGGGGAAGASDAPAGGGSAGAPAGGAGGAGGAAGAPALPAMPESLALAGLAWPEDVTVVGRRVFVSNFVSGGIEVFDLDAPEAGGRAFVTHAPDDPYASYWGLRALPARGWLVAVVQPFYEFDGRVPVAAQVRAYDLRSGALQKTWSTPDGTVGNSVDVDAEGNLYVGDIGPAARIVKIDPRTDAVSVWKVDGASWSTAESGVGLGGMVFDGDGAFYTAQGGTLWRVPRNADGTPGDVRAVALVDPQGAPAGPIFADGMTWAGDRTLYFAQNDAFTAGPHGTLAKIVFDAPDQGTLTIVKTELNDPSGVFAAPVDGVGYLFVNESQFGHVFQQDPGGPTTPFRVLVVPY